VVWLLQRCHCNTHWVLIHVGPHSHASWFSSVVPLHSLLTTATRTVVDNTFNARLPHCTPDCLGYPRLVACLPCTVGAHILHTVALRCTYSFLPTTVCVCAFVRVYVGSAQPHVRFLGWFSSLFPTHRLVARRGWFYPVWFSRAGYSVTAAVVFTQLYVMTTLYTFLCVLTCFHSVKHPAHCPNA